MSSIALTDVAAVLGLGLLCWGLRVALVVLFPADRLPEVVLRGLQFLAPAALASICAVELTEVVDTADLLGSAASVGVVALAVAVAMRTRNMTWTVLAGALAVLAIDLLPLAG